VVLVALGKTQPSAEAAAGVCLARGKTARQALMALEVMAAAATRVARLLF
jgi:hypothetical protein